MTLRPPGRRTAPILFGGLLVAAFLLYARTGNDSAARGARVLKGLDPAAEWVKKSGDLLLNSLWRRAEAVAEAVTGMALLFGIVAIRSGHRRALPLVLLLAGASLATWGQVLLWRGRIAPGAWLYAGAVACAAAVGVLRPLRRLPGIPPLPAPAEPAPSETPAGPPLAPFTAADWTALGALTLLGLLLRGYALTELPAFFDGEMTSEMVGSYTGFGLGYYMETEFLGTSTGVLQALTHHVLYRLYGASIFTIRLAALSWGLLAIPLLYWLARRIAGRTAAIVATVLFVAAPEQLYWSRSDNTHFAPIAVLALVTAHLCLSMQERFTRRSFLAAALWMPVCRYGYTPAYVLFTLPPLLAAHAAVFVRGAFRRLRYGAPILLGGLLLWFVSLSVVEFAVHPEGGLRFVNPTVVQGKAAWRRSIPDDAGPMEVLRAQAVRVTHNTGLVLAAMTYHSKHTTHWYERFFVGPERNTAISAGLAVLAALGIGYLLGQLRDRRAALLLVWIAIGLLPGCLSDEPEARRISLVFPVLPIAVGVLVAASRRMAEEAAGLRAARGLTAALAAAVVLTAFAGLASHFLLPIAPPELGGEMRFARPLFERCDMVLHNLVGPGHEIADIGALDALIRKHPAHCTELVEEEDWPDAALQPQCDFTDPVFQLTLSPEETERRRAGYRPKRIGYLLRATSESRPHIRLLRGLFPSATTREYSDPRAEEGLFAMEVPLSAIEALRAPEASAGGPEAEALVRKGPLKGAHLAMGSPGGPGLMIRGGLLLPEQGWYRFRLEPDCPAARLTVGTPASASPAARPLMAGVHPFEIQLGRAAGCRFPLEVGVESTGSPGTPISTILLSPRVVSQTQAPAVVAIPGYGPAKVLARLKERPRDIGMDGRGNIFVLGLGKEGWTLHRFAPDGREEGASRIDLPRGESVSLAVDPDGNCVLSCLFSVEILDHSGRPVHSWKFDSKGPPTDAAWTPDGRIYFCFPSRGSVEIFSRDGRLEGRFAPGERLEAPTGVAVAPDGTVLIVEETGLAHVFRTTAGGSAPARTSTFRVDYPQVPYVPDLASCAFDGAGRVLFPHRSLATPLAYDLEGRPLMASTPERDLSAKGLRETQGVWATRDALYVIDSNPPSVVRVARP